MKNAVLITIGTEILIGQTIDTNGAWIGEQLLQTGWKLSHKISIPDDEALILEALSFAEQKADLILTTGGLGPTKDDITKKTLAKWLNASLIPHPPSEQRIMQFYQERNRPLNPLALNQALIVDTAEAFINPVGAAPLMKINTPERKTLFCLPGVPAEMKALFNEFILPYLKQNANAITENFHLFVLGITETQLAQLLQPFEDHLPPYISLAYLPSFKGIKLRLSLFTQNPHHLTEFQQLAHELEDRCGKYVVSHGEPIEKVIFDLLIAQGKTIAVAESCTGGNLAGSMVKLPGASAVLQGAVVAYHNDIKNLALRVPLEVLEKYGAVSEPTAELMAKNIREIFQADIGIAASGIAGPTGQTPTKPVGTLCIAVATSNQTFSKTYQLGNNPREIFIERAIAIAWDATRRILLHLPF